MLTFAQFDPIIRPVTALFQEFETAVIADIARRLKNLSFSSAGWETQRLIESGALLKDVIKRVATLSHQSEAQVAMSLKAAGVQSVQFDDSVYRDAGLKPLPLNLSPAMAAALKAGIQKTNGVIENFTKTTALTSQKAFIRASTLAYLEVSTGTMSYDQAIRLAVRKVAAQGITAVTYPSGHEDHLDVAVRRAVLTGVSQTTGQLQMNRAGDMGVSLVAVSAHAGARNKGVGPANHESWQGKIYSLDGKNNRYPDFVKTTGYGTGEGLGGWNCRHSFYPYFEGISENAYSAAQRRAMADKKVSYQGKRIDLYEATQIQRSIERQIRYWKRQEDALASIDLNHQAETFKVRYWQGVMRSFIRQTGEMRQSARERI